MAQTLLHHGIDGFEKGQQVQGQIIDVVVSERPTKDSNKPSVHNQLILQISKPQLDEWVEEQSYWDGVLKYSRDNDLYPRNEKSCKWCKYHKICENATEAQQEVILKRDFRVRVWDYTKAGDNE